MGSHREFDTPTQRGSVDRHHNGLRAVLDLFEKSMQIQATAPALRRKFQKLDVGSGDESPPGANHDNGLDGRIISSGLECAGQAPRDVISDRIDRGIVYGNHCHTVLRLDVHNVAHNEG
jgi:hypothetical protein